MKIRKLVTTLAAKLGFVPVRDLQVMSRYAADLEDTLSDCFDVTLLGDHARLLNEHKTRPVIINGSHVQAFGNLFTGGATLIVRPGARFCQVSNNTFVGQSAQEPADGAA